MLFPARLLLVSLLGIADSSATQQVLDNIEKLTPSSTQDIISDAVQQLRAPCGIVQHRPAGARSRSPAASSAGSRSKYVA
ncbi:hypothetical protein ACFWP7_37160 [Streptomyces sp. NPDC058470]|uniref:hypothetical protein n=1 Tax=Streptomyces sp. NPDC058470 TaxID=3346515 RepID=UPI00364F7CE5